MNLTFDYSTFYLQFVKTSDSLVVKEEFKCFAQRKDHNRYRFVLKIQYSETESRFFTSSEVDFNTYRIENFFMKKESNKTYILVPTLSLNVRSLESDELNELNISSRPLEIPETKAKNYRFQKFNIKLANYLNKNFGELGTETKEKKDENIDLKKNFISSGTIVSRNKNYINENAKESEEESDYTDESDSVETLEKEFSEEKEDSESSNEENETKSDPGSKAPVKIKEPEIKKIKKDDGPVDGIEKEIEDLVIGILTEFSPITTVGVVGKMKERFDCNDSNVIKIMKEKIIKFAKIEKSSSDGKKYLSLKISK